MIDDMSQELYAILRRPYAAPGEHARWEIVKYSKSLNNVKKMTSNVSGNHGDLIVAVSVDHITDIANNAIRIAVVPWHGVTKKYNEPKDLNKYMLDIRRSNLGIFGSERLKNYTWLSVWEGVDAEPVRMIEMCNGVERGKIVKLCLDIQRAGMPYFDSYYNRIIEVVLSKIDKWLSGEFDRERMMEICRDYGDELSRNLLGITFKEDFLYSAKNAAHMSIHHASVSSGRLFTEVSTEFSEIVRQHIPLQYIMLKSLGDNLPST